MGGCLGVFGRKGSYDPRKMEQEDRTRNGGFQHNVYRKVNNVHAEKGFSNKTVVQPWPSNANGAANNQENVGGKDINDLIKDFRRFDHIDSPPEYPEVNLTEQQREKIAEYLSGLTRDDVSFCYQYFPPGLPPGPDGICVKHIEYCLDKGEPDNLFMVIGYLRRRQYNKLIQAFQTLNNFLELGISQEDITMQVLDIFSEWEDGYGTHSCTREMRALACYQAVMSATHRLEFEKGISFPVILFRVLHPHDEISGFLRVHGKNFVQSTIDREEEEGYNYPVEADSLASFRKEIFTTYAKKRAQAISEKPPSVEQLLKYDEAILSKIYHFDMDNSTLAQTIPKPGIGLCYYTLYRNYEDGAERETLLESPAPRGSSKEDVLRQTVVDFETAMSHHADSGRVKSPDGELKVIQSFSGESITLPDDLYEQEEAAERGLTLPGQQEFCQIKERAEKQKRWKRRFDSSKLNEQQEETP